MRLRKTKALMIVLSGFEVDFFADQFRFRLFGAFS